MVTMVMVIMVMVTMVIMVIMVIDNLYLHCRRNWGYSWRISKLVSAEVIGLIPFGNFDE